MNWTPTHNPWRRTVIGVCLIVLCVAAYFVTYNGYAVSRDEWLLFDATESLARRGNLRLNYEYDSYVPKSLDEARPLAVDTEPLQPLLAAGLFRVGQALPAVGLAHTVWLFNILVTALTLATFYAYGLALGYRARVVALAAAALGLGTIIWPYSRTFFREPLFTLLALLSVYLMRRLRCTLTGGAHLLLTVALTVVFGAVYASAVLSKEVAILILPAILIEALPSRLTRVRVPRRMITTLAALVVLGVVFVLILSNAEALFGINMARYDPGHRLDQARYNFSDMSEALKGYLFSPARGILFYSPVLLLGFFGWPRLVRQRQWRQIIMPLAVLVSFVLGYAFVRGAEQWYGGSGWGSRYLVPVAPFVALWLLPVFETLLERGAAWWARLGAGLVFLISLGVQLLAAAVPYTLYTDILAEQQPPVIPWDEGAWSWRWSPFRVLVDQIGEQELDFAWAYAVGDTWLLPVLNAGLAALSLAWLAWWITHQNGTRTTALITLGSVGTAAAVTLGLGLYAVRQDPRYFGDFDPTRDLLAMLEPALQDDDVIALNDDHYAEFFMNYYRQTRPPVFTLRVSPGERTSPEHTPGVVSPNPDALVAPSTTVTLGYFAGQYERVWLVINSSPFVTWSTRPVEHYLARHYFPVSEIKSTDTARAVLFDFTPAPQAAAPEWASQPVNATFGGNLTLSGFDIPGGVTRDPGDVLPVSLLWEAAAPVAEDYTVGLFLMTPDGSLAAQRDSLPVNGFEHTQSWRPGSFYRDNHGLALPDSLPPGEYELWVVVYWWQEPENRLAVTGASGEPIGSHVVLTTITIE
ncbi:MAG: hypothetical protein JW966_00295 [Anaerolineae bacterium]|nr:hypothetical protein [Anaerolineae bacterium]